MIAATNHGDRLDKALYRRFDDLIEFDPDVRAIYLISGRLSLGGTELAEGEAAIFDESAPPVMHSDGAFVATMAIPCVEVGPE